MIDYMKHCPCCGSVKYYSPGEPRPIFQGYTCLSKVDECGFSSNEVVWRRWQALRVSQAAWAVAEGHMSRDDRGIAELALKERGLPDLDALLEEARAYEQACLKNLGGMCDG